MVRYVRVGRVLLKLDTLCQHSGGSSVVYASGMVRGPSGIVCLGIRVIFIMQSLHDEFGEDVLFRTGDWDTIGVALMGEIVVYG